MKKIIFSSDAPAPIGPYSQAVLCSNTVYVSGQIAIDPITGDVFKGSIQDETRIVMNNLKAILHSAGIGFENVVKCSIFIKNMDDFKEINEVYGTFFPTKPPARETIEVSRLPKDVQVEVSCIAVT